MKRIVSWNLSPRLIHEVLEHLYEDLAVQPSQKLDLVAGQIDPLTYSFHVPAVGDPPRDYLFEFSVRYHADEETLVILDCDHVSLEPGPG